MKKIIMIFMALTLIMSSIIIPASALEYVVEDRGGGKIYINGVSNGKVTYSSSWKHTITCDGERGKITYGYNTFAYNEDTVKTYHSSKGHQAVVTNDAIKKDKKNPERSKWAKAGSWTGTVSVRHASKPEWKLLAN